MRTYNLILKGIESVAMPRTVSRIAAHLIRRLCKPVPAERLGYQRAGLQDVRQHKFVSLPAQIIIIQQFKRNTSVF